MGLGKELVQVVRCWPPNIMTAWISGLQGLKRETGGTRPELPVGAPRCFDGRELSTPPTGRTLRHHRRSENYTHSTGALSLFEAYFTSSSTTSMSICCELPGTSSDPNITGLPRVSNAVFRSVPWRITGGPPPPTPDGSSATPVCSTLE